MKSYFPYKDRLDRSQRSKVIYKASYWDCNEFCVGKTKRRLDDRKTERFKASLKVTSGGTLGEISYPTILLSTRNTFSIFNLRKSCFQTNGLMKKLFRDFLIGLQGRYSIGSYYHKYVRIYLIIQTVKSKRKSNLAQSENWINASVKTRSLAMNQVWKRRKKNNNIRVYFRSG